MPEESTTPYLVRLLRRTFELGNRRDFDALVDLWHHDYVWDLSPMGMGVYEGSEAIRGFFEDWLGSYDEFEALPEETHELGNGVVLAVITQHARIAGSSGRVEFHYSAVAVFDDAGLAVRTINYFDIDEARAAAERLAEDRGQEVSEENVEVVRRAIEVFNRDGPEAATAFMDPEIEWHDIPEQPDASVHHGREGFLEAVEQFAGGFEDFRVLIDEIFDHGNQVITYNRTGGRGRGSGATFEQLGACVWTLRNGSIARVEWFGTQREALKAVGLEQQAVSRENVDLLRKGIDAWNQHDADLWLSYAAPEIEWTPAGPAAVESAVYRGYDEVRSGFTEVWKTWDVFEFQERQVRDLGDSVLWLGRVRMRGSASQVELDQEFAIHGVLRDSRFVRVRAFLAWVEALEAVGLADQAMSKNLDLVRSIYADWERGDYSSVEWAHPEIEYVFADGRAPGSWTGKAAVREVWRDFLTAWEDYRPEVDEYRELDDRRVLVLVQHGGRGRASGVNTEGIKTPGANVFELRGGKVTRLALYWSRDLALADLSLEGQAVSEESAYEGRVACRVCGRCTTAQARTYGPMAYPHPITGNNTGDHS